MKKLFTTLAIGLGIISAPVMSQEVSKIEDCATIANVAGVLHDARSEGATFEGLITNVAVSVEEVGVRDMYYHLISMIFLTEAGDQTKREMMLTFFMSCAFSEQEG